jgi:predicted NBD/HSP70 family sugar kinase
MIAQPILAAHGAAQLPSVVVDSYNLEVKDENGFIGDRACKGAFRTLLDEGREPALDAGAFGKEPSAELSKKKIDALLAEGDVEAAGIVFGAVERFAQELAAVAKRFAKDKTWKGTQRIAVGGGMRDSRVGELAVGRAMNILRSAGLEIELRPIRNHPDEAGLLGAVHLAPSWLFSGHDSILAIDIGGTNIRAGLVKLNLKEAPDCSKVEIVHLELWRHRDEKATREEAVAKLIAMLKKLIAEAGKEDLRLAPFIGIGCPGIIEANGRIDRGSQNLPGNWTSERFHLPTLLIEAIPTIGDHQTAVVMHNDAVVQGLSEVPFMADVDHWGVLTIGTGLGNARFTNRSALKGD